MRVEFDDGKPTDCKAKNDQKHPLCTRRGREYGFYLECETQPEWIRIPVKFMRVSEMAGLAKTIEQAQNS